MNQQTIDMLTDMKLSAMAAEFAAQLKDSSFNALSFEERFSMAVTAEWNKRQTNKVNRLIKKAHLGAPSATVEGIEYYEDRKLDKSQMLRLSTCKYIDEGHHVILEGASGNGKTYIASALGNAACRRFKKVTYCAQQWRAEKAASLLQESRPSDFGRMADSSSYPTGVL